jgi:lysophospholipase L1-like esterase
MRVGLTGAVGAVVLVAAVGCSREAEAGDAGSLEAAAIDASATAADAIAEAEGEEAAVEAAAPAKHYRVVVHTGDSMVGGGLCKALAPMFKSDGTKFVRDVWEAASLAAFAESDRIPKLMKKYDPDLVLLTLGANDVFDKRPEYQIRYIESIVKKVGARDCYWIGPPLWKGDAGLVDVIHEHVAPCKFYDSSHLTLQRAGDGIHPTEKGGAIWAEQFWEFFKAQGSRLTEPATSD